MFAKFKKLLHTILVWSLGGLFVYSTIIGIGEILAEPFKGTLVIVGLYAWYQWDKTKNKQ